MMFDTQDTIAAVASGRAGAARGIVRISGSTALACVEKCLAAADALPLEGVMKAECRAAQLRLPHGAPPLPALVYLWPTARSYTREPMVELHTFGSPPLLEALVELVCRQGARLAEPGEFTLRAFLAGRLDLTQAEAVLGVIDARGEQQLDAALAQLAGGISRPLAALREELLQLLAHLEAGLDFVEEEIEFISQDELDGQLAAAEGIVAQLVEQMRFRGTSDSHVRIVLYGWPNVGKSSLFNALLQAAAEKGRHADGHRWEIRHTALVSDVAGTTRDYLEADLPLGDAICTLVDTAGLEAAASPLAIGRAAQAMTQAQQQSADIVLLCLDASRDMNDWERAALQQPVPAGVERIVVATKSDQGLSGALPAPAVATSSATGAGLAELIDQVNAAIQRRSANESHVVAQTAARCQQSLRQAHEALRQARAWNRAGEGEELVALELRSVLDAVGQVVGAVYTDDILDRIFSRFCIGK